MFNSIPRFLAQAGSGAIDSYNAGSIKPGFRIPIFSEVMTFIIRGFFIVAGLIALLYLLLGALAWITSGGNKESVEKAREKIQAALIGIILVFAVLAIVGVVENILGLSLGVTKDIVFPKLIGN